MTHRYRSVVRWSGSTAVGYEAYDRTHQAEVPAAGAELTLSADPHFRGDPSHLNPEQLLVLAAASCQLLSFLAAAARARIDVLAYEDDSEGVMPEDDRPIRVTTITLRPRIRVVAGPGATEERVRHLCDVAHRECFIASSLKTDVRLEPVIEIVEG